MNIDFSKLDGLVPVVIQDFRTLQVLMVGFMNQEAYEKSVAEGRVTFFSRSKKRLWTKGETSGNFLTVKEITIDCDNDSLLIKVDPAGPVCHNGTTSCFAGEESDRFLYKLEKIIEERIAANDAASYTNKIYRSGINKAAQKVGEEAVELIIEAKDNDIELFKNEAADLLYHFLILLKTKNISLSDVENVLSGRHK